MFFLLTCFIACGTNTSAETGVEQITENVTVNDTIVENSADSVLINRVYDKKPVLSPDFLTINPSQTNNIFSVTETNDKFIGLIHVGLKMKRPIPKYGIPKLEA